MTPDDVAALKAEYDERTHILHLHYTGRRVLSGTQLEEAETLHWDIQCAYIAALEADRDHWQQRALAGMNALTQGVGQSAVTFTVCRAADYEGDVYTPEELSSRNYIVFLGNGDSNLLDTVEDIEALLSSELFLHGYSDDGQEAT